MRVQIAALGAVVVVLCGCAQIPPVMPADDIAAPATTSGDKSPVSEPETTPAQWAAGIAPVRADWARQNAMWATSGCGTPEFESGDPGCLSVLKTLLLTVEMMDDTVGGMDNPVTIDFVGKTPPAEIHKVYSRLVEALDIADRAQSDVDCPGDACAETAMLFILSWNDLEAPLTAWDPWV